MFQNREKTLLISGDDFGQDLSSVQNLQENHGHFEKELENHGSLVKDLLSRVDELLRGAHYASDDIKERSQQLQEMWSDLNEASKAR